MCSPNFVISNFLFCNFLFFENVLLMLKVQSIDGQKQGIFSCHNSQLGCDQIVIWQLTCRMTKEQWVRIPLLMIWPCSDRINGSITHLKILTSFVRSMQKTTFSYFNQTKSLDTTNSSILVCSRCVNAFNLTI